MWWSFRSGTTVSPPTRWNPAPTPRHGTRPTAAGPCARLPASRICCKGPSPDRFSASTPIASVSSRRTSAAVLAPKNQVYPEQVLVMLAARRVGRPVRWLATRAEMMISDAQGRDQRSKAALAVAADGRFLAVRAKTVAALGAYFSPRGLVSPIAGGRTLPGVYDIPAASYRRAGRVHQHGADGAVPGRGTAGDDVPDRALGGSGGAQAGNVAGRDQAAERDRARRIALHERAGHDLRYRRFCGQPGAHARESRRHGRLRGPAGRQRSSAAVSAASACRPPSRPAACTSTNVRWCGWRRMAGRRS